MGMKIASYVIVADAYVQRESISHFELIRKKKLLSHFHSQGDLLPV